MSEITPWILYGTAWKKERTTELVESALRAGFAAVDTANQPKHYSEPLVGDALRKLSGEIPREKLFLQTKFTPLGGQDSRVPYDGSAALASQVCQSFESSLEHLDTDYLDSYLLHGPYHHPGLGEEDWEVWEAMEQIHRSGGARKIGISNVNSRQLEALLQQATVKPMVVQNRCFARLGWDREVRELCRKHGIMYQGFSLLTANPEALGKHEVRDAAARLNATPEQVIFCFARQVGMVPLTGTTDRAHMREDLGTRDLELKAAEVEAIEG